MESRGYWPELGEPDVEIDHDAARVHASVPMIWRLLEQDQIDPTMTAQRRR